MKNEVFQLLVRGTGMCRHFRRPLATENEGSGKPRFPLPWLKKAQGRVFWEYRKIVMQAIFPCTPQTRFPVCFIFNHLRD